jgi:hypothetical protein
VKIEYGVNGLIAGDDASIIKVDISNLSPKAAVSKLQDQNNQLIARVRYLKNVSSENERLNGQINELRSHSKQLEADLASRTDLFRSNLAQSKYVVACITN